MTAIAMPLPGAARAEFPWGSLRSPWTAEGEAKAPMLDYFAAIAWVFVTTFVMWGFLSPLRYLLAGYFVYALCVNWRTLLPMAGKNFVFFIIPILMVISSLWAPSPNDAIRHGLLMAMTVIAAIFVAGRLHPKQIIRAYFYVMLFAGITTCLHPGMAYGPATGVFPQKNVLAVFMFFLYVSGLAIALDKQEDGRLRLVALLSLPIALVFIKLAESATTIGFSVVITAAFFGQKAVWEPAMRTPHARTFIVLGLIVIAAVAGIVLFGILQIDAGDALLGALGKDSSLTGRTYLWEQARAIMHDKPWTGVGADGFWREWRGQANSITNYFHFEHFVTFNFHNSYLELGVQLGYPGMYTAIAICCWALFNVIRRWVFNQTLANFYFMALAVMVVIHSNTEIDLSTEFGPTLTVMMVATMILTKRPRAPVAIVDPTLAPQTPPPAPRTRARSRT
jgi:exopolysaccharide production protein ExoQ